MILGVGFEMHLPCLWIVARLQCRFCEFDGFRAGIDQSTDVLPVPFQYKSDIVSMSRGRTPISVPCPCQRMPFLSKAGGKHRETDEDRNQGYRSNAHIFSF